MTSSRTTPFLSEIADLDKQIPVGKLEYLRERLRNNLYHFIVSKFLEQQKTRGLTKVKLARRIGSDPGRLNKLLGAPGNWTIATVSDLLVGISAEELIPASQSLVDRVPGNFVVHGSYEIETASDLKVRDKIASDWIGSGSDSSIELTQQ